MRFVPWSGGRIQLRHFAVALVVGGIIAEYGAASSASGWTLSTNAWGAVGELVFVAWLASPILLIGFLTSRRLIGPAFALLSWAACVALAVYAAQTIQASTSSLAGLVLLVEPVYAFVGLGVFLVLRAGVRSGPRPSH